MAMLRNRGKLISVIATGIALCIALVFLPSECCAQKIYRPTSKQNKAIAICVRNYMGAPYPAFERQGATRYSAALVDLKDDGTREAIVYVTGRGACGTGGCMTLVLAPRRTSYKVTTGISISRPPIRVLAAKSNGWHDIAVWVQGGGILPGYEARLSFNGQTYPSNPSVPPAQQLASKVPGKTLDLDGFGKVLYP